jgi:flagellar basal-body rod protein FlgF
LVRGLYTAASGALVAQSQADTVANNLANVNTNGFKATLLQVQSAPSMDIYRVQTDPGTTSGSVVPGVSTAQYVGALGTGASIYDTPSVFAQGSLEQTGNGLDLALAGSNGFFAVQTGNGVRYTRDGQFLRDNNGNLATQDGDAVLGTNGQSINIPQGPFAVGTDGTISQNGQRLGQLQVSQFANLTALRPQGDNYFIDSGAAGPSTATNASVQQGFLEKSGTNTVRSMVDLITAERWYEANTKMIQTQDAATQQAVQTLARSTPQ